MQYQYQVQSPDRVSSTAPLWEGQDEMKTNLLVEKRIEAHFSFKPMAIQDKNSLYRTQVITSKVKEIATWFPFGIVGKLQHK